MRPEIPGEAVSVDIGTIIGLVIAVGCILISVVIGGGSPMGLINGPSIFVVIGGTLGAVIVSYPLATILKLHKVVLKAVFTKPTNTVETIRDLVRYAEVARREHW